MARSNCGTIALHCANPGLLCAGLHISGAVSYVLSPFVDARKPSQTIFSHESLFLVADTSRHRCYNRPSTEPTRLAVDRTQIQLGFGITPACSDVGTKIMAVRPHS